MSQDPVSSALKEQAAWELLQSAKLPGDKVKELLTQALDLDYWRALNPELSIREGAYTETGEWPGLSEDELNRSAQRFGIDAYFRTGPVLPAPLVDRMRKSVDVLRGNRWLPAFTFVYDEFWTVFRLAPVRQLVATLLGPDSRQNSTLWTYYVDTRDGLKGWSPHADANGERRLTIWVPLADATVDNGCMYVIPRSRMPGHLAPEFAKWDSLGRDDLLRVLQGVRALPAKAGSLLGWDHNVVHWGSVSSGAVSPRISIGVEFVGAGVKPRNFELPLVDGTVLPPLKFRLHAIGRSILSYSRFEPLLIRYEELGQKLAEL